MKIDYLPYLRKKVGHDLVLSVGLSVLVVDRKRRKVLLEKRADNGLYCLPGGSIDLGEKVEDGARRELFEETGVIVGPMKLFMVLSGEECRLSYPNGDVTEYCDFIFIADYDSENYVERHDRESTAVSFVDFDLFPEEKACLRGTYRIFRRFMTGDETLLID